MIINGPRFSTKSESKWFSDAGWEVISMTQYPEAYLCRELGMAVVNIALITDYDAGVLEGTEAVDAQSVTEVFAQNAARIQQVVLDMIGRFPADLDALGARDAARVQPRRRPRDHARGHPPVRDGALAGGRGDRLPIGVTIRTIRAEPGWWLESAKRLDAAGYQGVWAWDHFVGQGDRTVPVVESWTILSMAAAATSRVTVGPFVVNVMNRHPAVLARMASTLQIASGGRLILGMGIGGAPKEHAAYGIDFPEAKERVGPPRGGDRGDPGPLDRRPGDAAVAVLPARGRPRVPGPDPAAADRHRRRDAGRGAAGRPDRRRLEHVRRQLRAEPAALPRGARGGRAGGARTSALYVGFQGDWLGDADIAESPWCRAPRESWERWREAGADGAIVLARTTSRRRRARGGRRTLVGGRIAP